MADRGPRKKAGKKPAARQRGQASSSLGGRRGETGASAGLTPRHTGSVFLYGRNSVEAALKNRGRTLHALYVGDKANPETLAVAETATKETPVIRQPTHRLDASLPAGTPHQSIILETSPLPQPDLFALAEQDEPQLFVILDQVTDPQNVGACLRSIAGLGATALITQDRNSPPESGALARAAAGALETTPWIRVGNISKTLEALRDYGFWSLGLSGDADDPVTEVSAAQKTVLVMGSEGRGLRSLVAKTCDQLVFIPMTDRIESFNVSVAAALSVHALLPDALRPGLAEKASR